MKTQLTILVTVLATIIVLGTSAALPGTVKPKAFRSDEPFSTLEGSAAGGPIVGKTYSQVAAIDSAIYVNPALTNKLTNQSNVGDTFKVTINLANVTVRAYAYKLYWNSSVLNFIGIKDNVGFTQYTLYNNETTNSYNATYGRFYFNVSSSKFETFTAGPLGTAIREVTFEIMRAPPPNYGSYTYTKLDLTDTALTDQFLNPITHQALDGEFYYYYVNGRIYIDPQTTSWTYPANQVGSTFTVNIKICNITDLKGYAFTLYWQNSILNFQKVQDFVPYAGYLIQSNESTNNYNATYGRFYFSVNSTKPQSFSVGPGGYTIRQVTFMAVSLPPYNGGSFHMKLDLTETVFRHTLGPTIIHNEIDGEFDFLNPVSQGGYGVSREPMPC